jgi:hypothetical protein
MILAIAVAAIVVGVRLVDLAGIGRHRRRDRNGLPPRRRSQRDGVLPDHRAPNRPVHCIVEAQDEEFGIVGWRLVTYPGSEHSRAFTEHVPIVSAATTGLVNSCWVS